MFKCLANWLSGFVWSIKCFSLLLFLVQIITRVKGGEIGRARQGPDMGLRTITISKDTEKLGLYFGDEVPASLAIVKCHQDEVLELPDSATVLASSEVCQVEMFSIGDHLLCIQGHPEYNKEILFEIVDRVLNMKLMEVCSCPSSMSFNVCIAMWSIFFLDFFFQQEFADKAKSTMETAEPDKDLWQKLCKNFLKGQIWACLVCFAMKTCNFLHIYYLQQTLRKNMKTIRNNHFILPPPVS